MPRAFDKPDQQENYVQSNWTVGIAAALGVIMFGLVVLMSNSPAASNWVSEAVQAEFVGSSYTPQQAPVQTAQPAKDLRTVSRAN